MGMKPYSYVVVGIKTTREQCKADGIDLYEQFEDETSDIRAIHGEGSDDVLIGKVLFETDPYEDAEHAIELTLPDKEHVALDLGTAGVNASHAEIGMYAITVWL